MSADVMNYTVVINCFVWFGALAYYFIDARKWFTGPKITIETDNLTEEQRVAIREEGLKVDGVGKGATTSSVEYSGNGSGEEGKFA